MADDNIYKRGPVWWGRIQVAGRRLGRSLRTGDRAEARKRFATWEAEIRHAQFHGEARLTWEAAVLRYAEEVMPDAVKPSTRKRYMVSFRAVDPHLRGKYMDQIDKVTLARVIGQRKKAGAINATVRRDLTAMSRVFAASITWGACEHNIPLEYDRSLIRERRDPVPLPEDEQIALAIGGQLGRMVAWALHTGMRQDELLRLTWDDVDLERRAIVLTKTKTDRPRAIPLTETAVATILATPRKEGVKLVMWHGRGLPYRNFSSQFRAWRTGQGVGFRFHDLRHKYAVEYLRRGGNIYDLQKILGHKSIKTTELYLDYLTPDEARAATGTKVATDIGGSVVPFDRKRTVR